MIYAHPPTVLRIDAGRDDIQIGKGEPVMFVVMSDERQRGVLVNDLGAEHLCVPVEHFCKAARPVNDMDGLGRRHGHQLTPSPLAGMSEMTSR